MRQSIHEEPLSQIKVLGYRTDYDKLLKFLSEDNSNGSHWFRGAVKTELKRYEKKELKERKNV